MNAPDQDALVKEALGKALAAYLATKTTFSDELIVQIADEVVGRMQNELVNLEMRITQQLRADLARELQLHGLERESRWGTGYY